MSTLTLTKKNTKDLNEAARLMGVNKKEFVERAVLFYLESVRATLDLEKEFRAWEGLSDEAFQEMEKRLGSKL